MLVRSPSTGPIFTLRTVTVLSGFTTYTNAPDEPFSTAGVGTMVASLMTSTSSFVFTNWFGNSMLSLLSKRARSLTVPVVVSIWLSMVSR